MVENYQQSLLEDKGGASSVSNAEVKAVEIAQAARVCWLLALAEFSNAGVMREDVTLSTSVASDGKETSSTINKPAQLHPGFREMSKYMGLELKALSELGLSRRAAPVKTLQEYIEETEAGSSDPV